MAKKIAGEQNRSALVKHFRDSGLTKPQANQAADKLLGQERDRIQIIDGKARVAEWHPLE